MTNALIVPVMHNFKGFTELIQSVDLPVVPFIYNNWDTNDGVTIAWNRCIEDALDYGADYLFIANDDTVFFPGTMEKMIEVIDWGYDLVTPVNARDFSVSFERNLLPHADFSSFLITPKTIDRFGMFDENIHSYFNDNDYAWRIKVGGGKYCSITDAGFYHVGSVTQNYGGDGSQAERVVSHEAFDLAKEYYISKWGGEPGEEKTDVPFGTDWNTL